MILRCEEGKVSDQENFFSRVPEWRGFTLSKHDWQHLTALFCRYQNHDPSVVDELMRSLLGYLSGFLVLKGCYSQDAEDIAQSALLKIHINRDRFDAQKSLQNWVSAIAERTLIDTWRANRRIRVGQGDIGNQASERGNDGELLLTMREIEKTIGTLKPMEQAIVNLHVTEGKQLAEIGAELELSSSAVKLRLHRARKFLRDAFLR